MYPMQLGLPDLTDFSNWLNKTAYVHTEFVLIFF